jgi:hypothetical protein
MKSLKSTKVHHGKSRAASHPAPIPKDAAEFWELDHDRPDPDMQLYRIERTPKQENL